MNKQPEALRLSVQLEREWTNEALNYDTAQDAWTELRSLHALNQELVVAYRKMRNSAAGYSNYCEDSASVRRCERDFEEADAMFRAAIAKATGEQP